LEVFAALRGLSLKGHISKGGHSGLLKYRKNSENKWYSVIEERIKKMRKKKKKIICQKN
jgi:hypothetical protein